MLSVMYLTDSNIIKILKYIVINLASNYCDIFNKQKHLTHILF